MKNAYDSKIDLYILGGFIVICIIMAFCHNNWVRHIYNYKDLTLFVNITTILLTLGGAIFAYVKWESEKKSKINEQKRDMLLKNASGIIEPFISFIIRQETYRRSFIDEKKYSRENLPIITAFLESKNNIYSISNLISGDIYNLLKNADRSSLGHELLQLINQYLLYAETEEKYRKEMKDQLYNQSEGRCSKRDILSLGNDYIEKEMQALFLDPNAGVITNIYEKKKPHLRDFPVVKEYCVVVKNLKAIEIKLIEKMIEEYNDLLTILEGKHDVIEWNNILEKAPISPLHIKKESEKEMEMELKKMEEQTFSEKNDSISVTEEPDEEGPAYIVMEEKVGLNH